jgi:hypothetical protein
MEAHPLRLKRILPVSVAALALVAAGCGDDDDEGSEESAATPAEAIAEIARVRTGLSAGLAAYERGNAEQADTLIGDAYLEHFEIVEGPLEDVDPELNEELEELISTEIRDEIEAGADAAQVQKLVAEAQEGLSQAEAALSK